MVAIHFKTFTCFLIIASVTLACRIGGVEFYFDEANQRWIETVTGADVSHIITGPESAGITPGQAVETIAETGEICVLNAQTPFCIAALSGDEEAIGNLSVELRVNDLAYISEASKLITESLASLNTTVPDQP